MSLDAATNFAKATVALGFTSGATSILLVPGSGIKYPAPPFNGVVWNATDYGDPADDPFHEIVRVTAISTDTLTVTRAQEGTANVNHNTAGKSYLFVAGPTAKLITDISSMVGGATPPQFVQTADSTTTANVVSTLFGTGVGTLTIPANRLAVGSFIRISLSGYVSQTAPNTSHIMVMSLGGTTVATGASVAGPNAGLNSVWIGDAYITCRTIGVAGTVVGAARFAPFGTVVASRALFVQASGSAGPATVDTTSGLVLDLTLNNGNVNGTYTTTSALVEILG